MAGWKEKNRCMDEKNRCMDEKNRWMIGWTEINIMMVGWI